LGIDIMLFLKVHHAWPFAAENLVHPLVFSFPGGFDLYVVPLLGTTEIKLKNNLIFFVVTSASHPGGGFYGSFGIRWSLTPGPGCPSSFSSRLIAFRCLGSIFDGF